MLKMKKLLSVALVVVMALSMFVMSTSALEDGKTFGFVVEADKKVSEIVPGATVTVFIRYEMSDFNQLMSDIRFALLFDDTVYTPVTGSRTYLNDAANYAKDATQFTINPAFATTTMSKSSMTAEEQAKYNSCVMQVMSADASLGALNKVGYSVTEDPDMPGVSLPEISVQFTVTGDAAAIAAGNINIALCDTSVSAAQYIKQTYNDGKAPVVIAQENVSMARANILANMPEEPAGPVVAKNKAEVRFTYDTATDNGVADEFKLRIKSVVTAADWDAYFANTEDDAATTNKITAVGMVAFPTNEEFVEETALAAISAGASANYKAAKTDYIQKASNDSDAYFGAIINIKHSTCADGLNYIGFVQYLDASGAEQVIFYEAGAEFANVGSANYDTLVNTFKTQYPA